MDAIGKRGVDLFHRLDLVVVPQASLLLPEVALAALRLQACLEDPVRQLLDLIQEEGEHHQEGEDDAQILLPVSEVVLEMVALVLQCVEGLVLDPPAGSTRTHDPFDIPFAQPDVRHPGELARLSLRPFLEVTQVV